MPMRSQAPRSGGGRGKVGGDPPPFDRADAVETARYIADMAAQMQAMAAAAKLDFLAYLLGMIRAESEAVGRSRD